MNSDIDSGNKRKIYHSIVQVQYAVLIIPLPIATLLCQSSVILIELSCSNYATIPQMANYWQFSYKYHIDINSREI